MSDAMDAECIHGNRWDDCQWCWKDDGADKQDTIDAIDALHRRNDGEDWCAMCGIPWPCPTHELIHP